MPDPHVDAPRRQTALVIGGGLAGIAAALALARHGAQVTLLEAKRKLGGRAGSYTASTGADSSQEYVDYCQHVGMGCCRNLQQLISWLDQRHAWDVHRELHFYGPAGDYQRLRAWPWVPAPLHLLPWLARWPGLDWSDRISVARGVLKIRQLELSDSVDDIPAKEWLSTHQQTERALSRFWSTLVVSALGEELSRVSLRSVAHMLQVGFLKHREAFHLWVPNRPLNTLFQELTLDKLAELGVQVKLSTPAQRVQDTGAREPHRFQVACRDGSYSADAVVVAIPWHQTHQLNIDVGPPSSQLIGTLDEAAQMGSSPISGVHSWWDRPWLETPHATIVGRVCQWVFPKASGESSEPADGDEVYYQIVISASRELPKPSSRELSSLIQSDLAAVFPRVRQARLLRLRVVTDPQAVFSVTPGQQRRRPTTQTAVSGLVLAGDWTRTGWPATMEGAVLSGFRAAEATMEHWGRPASIVCGDHVS